MTYTGARGRTDFTEAARKTSTGRWAVQPKVDGAYCEIETDRAGRVRSVRTRSGARMKVGAHLVGHHTGAANAVLFGEFEGYTEAGRTMAERSGVARVHLFDVGEIDGREIGAEPYRVRRDILWRAYAACADAHPGVDSGRCHWAPSRAESGKFAPAAKPINWGLFPIVPQMANVDQAWADWVVMPFGRDPSQGDHGEGLVVVSLDAPIGRRRAKQKLKTVETADVRVMLDEGKRVVCLIHGQRFAVGKNGKSMKVGDIVELAHNGFYPSGVPRFPRIVRVRDDMVRRFASAQMQ